MTTQVLPGQQILRVPTDRQFLTQAAKDRATSYGVVIDGTLSYDGGHTSAEKYIRGGMLMAQDATTKKFMPVKRTFATTAVTGTALVVNDANNFRVLDTVIVGDNATNIITAIVFSTNTITLTDSITWYVNDRVSVINGRGQARGVLLDSEVSLWNADKSSNVDANGQLAIATREGNEDVVLGDLTACLEDPASLLGGITFKGYQINSETIAEPGPFVWRKQMLTANTTLVAADSGTEFYVNAAATITLPSLATAGKGFRIKALNVADTNLTIAAPANKMVVFNDVAATSIAFSTTSEKAGNAIEITLFPDETFYFGAVQLAADSVTVTIT